ncbi:glutaredoxin 3 [Paracoccus aminophilus]|uniref:Glutaredoxin n=1 Tax=Paracoccus aminophilus JCM 7686 TaxID=1367847 RepID=S5Y2R1_PARAH|nr:glutaredoxin 3 [Paracoccus aminophilus]AGT10025.1 glutaredoxin 3 [Paracoccus aminophilus JCM 7686]
MAKIEIYLTDTCPFCHRAKALLTAKGVPFTEINVTGDPDARAAMTERANGRHTVPQIFINSESIGGNDRLQALEMRGQLNALIGL